MSVLRAESAAPILSVAYIQEYSRVIRENINDNL